MKHQIKIEMALTLLLCFIRQLIDSTGDGVMALKDMVTDFSDPVGKIRLFFVQLNLKLRYCLI